MLPYTDSFHHLSPGAIYVLNLLSLICHIDNSLGCEGEIQTKVKVLFPTYNLFSFLLHHNVHLAVLIFKTIYKWQTLLVLNLHFSNSIFWRLIYILLSVKHSLSFSIPKTCLPPKFKILHPLHPNYFPAFSLSLSFCIQPIKISLTTPSE